MKFVWSKYLYSVKYTRSSHQNAVLRSMHALNSDCRCLRASILISIFMLHDTNMSNESLEVRNSPHLKGKHRVQDADA